MSTTTDGHRAATHDGNAPPHLRKCYDRDAQPVEFGRVVALSDGVFAIALTLLVLDLALPAGTAGPDLGSALAGMQGKLSAFAVSVVVVGLFYYFHHRLFSMTQQLDGMLLSLNIPYLGLVVLIPFAQGVLSEHPTEPLAYVLFAAVLGSVSVVDGLMLGHAHRRGLLRKPLPAPAARIETLRAAVPVGIFLASMPLAYLLGAWTVLLWLSIWPIDGLLARLEAADRPAEPRGDVPTAERADEHERVPGTPVEGSGLGRRGTAEDDPRTAAGG